MDEIAETLQDIRLYSHYKIERLCEDSISKTVSTASKLYSTTVSPWPWKRSSCQCCGWCCDPTNHKGYQLALYDRHLDCPMLLEGHGERSQGQPSARTIQPNNSGFTAPSLLASLRPNSLQSIEEDRESTKLVSLPLTSQSYEVFE